MKTYFKIILSLLLATGYWLLATSSIRAAYCDPPLTGNWTISAPCVLYEDVNGTALGDVNLQTGTTLTIHGNKTLVWYPGQKITIPAGASIIVNNTGQIKQAFICTEESGIATGYAKAAISYEQGTGAPLYQGLSQNISSSITNTATDPVAWWKFDDDTGQTTVDSSGNGITATLVNTPTWITGRLGYALSFASASQEYATATNTLLDNIAGNSDAGNFTLSAWVYRTGAGNTYVIGKIGAVGTGGFGMLIGNQGEVYCRTDNGTTYQDSYTATGKVPASTWTHIAVTRGLTSAGAPSSTSCLVYINGVNTAITPGSHTLSGNTNAVNIGARSGAPESYFPGWIDDVRIYNRALSATEISRMYDRNCSAGFKRREDFLSKDLVDMGTTGTTGALASVYRDLLNLGMSIYNNLTLALVTAKPTGTGSPVTILGDNLQVCSGAACTLTPPADYGNLIIENKLGIGTGTPGYALHVAGGSGTNIRVEGSTNPRFSLNQTGGGVDQKRWQNYAFTNTLRFTALNDAESAEIVWLDVNRGTGTAISSLVFPNGNIGIGTFGPNYKLSVVSADNETTSFAQFVANNLTAGVELWYAGIRMGGTNTNQTMYLDGKGTGNILMNTTGTGNVGIGVTPTHKLQVAGRIHADITGGDGGLDSTTYEISGTNIGSQTSYAYGAMCVANASGDCSTASSGTVFNNSANYITGATTFANTISTNGSSTFAQSDNTNTVYWAAPIQLREAQYGATSGYKAPRLSFHWSGVVASQISIDASGNITILDNPGTSYANLISQINYANTGFRVANDTSTIMDGNQFYCNNGSNCHFNYSGTGTTYIGNTQNTHIGGGGGKLGIGSATTPTYTLAVTGSANITGGVDMSQNTRLQVGQAYLSSGGNYAFLNTNAWYNGSTWTQTADSLFLLMDGVQARIQKIVAGVHTVWATVSGTGGWTAGSSRQFKQNIKELTDTDYDRLREQFLATPLYSYNRKDSPNEPEVGFIAEEAPEYILSGKDKTQVTLMKGVGYLAAITKGKETEIRDQKEKITSLEKIIREMQNEINSLKNISAK